LKSEKKKTKKDNKQKNIPGSSTFLQLTINVSFKMPFLSREQTLTAPFIFVEMDLK